MKSAPGISMHALLQQLVHDGHMDTGTMVALLGLDGSLAAGATARDNASSDGDDSFPDSFVESDPDMEPKAREAHFAQFVYEDGPEGPVLEHEPPQSQEDFLDGVQAIIEVLQVRQMGDDRGRSGDCPARAHPPSRMHVPASAPIASADRLSWQASQSTPTNWPR